MFSKVFLISNQENEIQNFLEKFSNKKIELENPFFWKKGFTNPIDISEIIAAFIDNINTFNLVMWISLDKDIFIKISSENSNAVIKYLFERYPY